MNIEVLLFLSFINGGMLMWIIFALIHIIDILKENRSKKNGE